MAPHVLLLSVLQSAWGGIGLLLGVSMLMLGAGALAIGTGEGADTLAAFITAAAFALFALALLAAGGANAWGGTALRRHDSRGRLVVLGLAVTNLFVLPFGTALGIYAFWVLLHNETRTMFEGQDAARA